MVTNTYQLLSVQKKLYPVIMFFKNRYFPDGKNFHSDEVLIECKKAGRKIAPFVVPYHGGIAMESQKYSGYKFAPAYISPKSIITVQDLRDKAFGEDPNSGRSAESRQNELQAERMDELRQSILRTIEKMCTDIITTGSCVMKHYAKPEDFGTDKYVLKRLQFYENEFENKYALKKNWKDMTVQEKLLVFYDMARILKKRSVKATDIVLGSDASSDLFSDLDFLEYFNKRNVDFGTVKPEEIPDGVTFNGTLNINGIMMNFFSYDETYEDLDGVDREFIPAGTIAMLTPGMGTTAYGPVDFVGDDGSVHSYAEQIVPHVTADSNNNLITVYESSRPVPYPYDFDGWLVADINEPVDDSVSDSQALTLDDRIEYKTVDEINSMTKKADVIAYGTSIGVEGLSDTMSLTELKEAVVAYQDELEAAGSIE